MAGTAFKAFAQDFDHARDLVARVQDDLQSAADFTRNNEKERVRYENVQHHLSEFDRELRHDHFDKGKLDDAINDLKNVVKKNTLNPPSAMRSPPICRICAHCATCASFWDRSRGS